MFDYYGKVKQMVIVLDASNLVLGRLASETAQILLGKRDKITGTDSEGKTTTINVKPDDMVYIINAEHCIITGDPKKTTQRYLERVHKKVLTNPRRGPFNPRQPEEIVKRAVRGMIGWKKPSGKRIYKKLRVYVGVPNEDIKNKAITFTHISADKTLSKRITVGELGRRLSTFGNKAHLIRK
jgi:large subunit ribosomal protein L13